MVEVKPGERRALFWSFAYFFLILSAYYVLRPLRVEIPLAELDAAVAGLAPELRAEERRDRAVRRGHDLGRAGLGLLGQCADAAERGLRPWRADPWHLLWPAGDDALPGRQGGTRAWHRRIRPRLCDTVFGSDGPAGRLVR